MKSLPSAIDNILGIEAAYARHFQYADIPGFPGYRAKADGTLWTCKARQYSGFGKVKWVIGSTWRQIRTRQRVKDGRRMCELYDATGRKVGHHVSHWILLAFRGPPKVGFESRHMDGDCTNDNLSNLEWGTHADNIADKERHGTKLCGDDLPWTKVTREQADEIRRIGLPAKQHVEKYGVSETTIYNIIHGRTRR